MGQRRDLSTLTDDPDPQTLGLEHHRSEAASIDEQRLTTVHPHYPSGILSSREATLRRFMRL